MNPMKNLHPGEILKNDYLEALGISAYRLANDLNIPQTRISQILKCRRRISADTALRLSAYFGTGAQYWLGLQDDYDLEETRLKIEEALNAIKKFSTTAPDGLTEIQEEVR
ncbi:MAG: HigA family addiction module antitoxin [Saccharofermentanales bacterium]